MLTQIGMSRSTVSGEKNDSNWDGHRKRNVMVQMMFYLGPVADVDLDFSPQNKDNNIVIHYHYEGCIT